MSRVMCSRNWIGIRRDPKCIKKKLNARCMPSGVVRENGAKRYDLCISLLPCPLSSYTFLFIHALRRSFVLFTSPSSSILDTEFSKVNRCLPLPLLPLIFSYKSLISLSYKSFLIHSTCPN